MHVTKVASKKNVFNIWFGISVDIVNIMYFIT